MPRSKCPFQQLAARHTALACGMNLALIEGPLLALQPAGVTARLEPAPGRCCVIIDLPAEAAEAIRMNHREQSSARGG